MIKNSKVSQFINLPIYLLFLSIIYFVFYFMGFVFHSQLINYITIFIAFLLLIKEWKTHSIDGKKCLDVLYSFTPLIALVFIISRLMATTTQTASFNIMVIIVLACSLVVYFRCWSKAKQKFAINIIYGVLVGVIFKIAVTSLLMHFFWITPVETDRISELSPSSMHVVNAVQRSSGALGGSTTVTVQGTTRFNLLLGELQYRPVSIHHGGWTEFFHIERIRWYSDSRFYMYRSVYRGGHIYAFESTGRTWRRVE